MLVRESFGNTHRQHRVDTRSNTVETLRVSGYGYTSNSGNNTTTHDDDDDDQKRSSSNDYTAKRHKISFLSSWFSVLFLRFTSFFHSTFLPEGFPRSVGPDYVQYQIWDTLQALCSAITGTLSTRAILHGVGVGNGNANVISGTLQWIVRDGTGMVGRIYFASHIASDLDNDMKRWRIAADVCNDIGLSLEIACSIVSTKYFLVLVCTAAVFKAVTAVAGLATRSTMAQHFSRRQNMADISAKNGSQETAVSFIGMFLGMLVAAFVPPTFFYTSLVFAIVTILHIYCNVKGVKSLVIHHFSQTRLDIALGYFALHLSTSGGGDADADATTICADPPSGENAANASSSSSASSTILNMTGHTTAPANKQYHQQQTPPIRGIIPTPEEMRHIEGVFLWPNPVSSFLPKNATSSGGSSYFFFGGGGGGGNGGITIGVSVFDVAKQEDPMHAAVVIGEVMEALQSRSSSSSTNGGSSGGFVILYNALTRRIFIILQDNVQQREILYAYILAQLTPFPLSLAGLKGGNHVTRCLFVLHQGIGSGGCNDDDGVPSSSSSCSEGVVSSASLLPAHERQGNLLLAKFLSVAEGHAWVLDKGLFKLKEWRLVMDGE